MSFVRVLFCLWWHELAILNVVLSCECVRFYSYIVRILQSDVYWTNQSERRTGLQREGMRNSNQMEFHTKQWLIGFFLNLNPMSHDFYIAFRMQWVKDMKVDTILTFRLVSVLRGISVFHKCSRKTNSENIFSSC